MLHFKCTVCGDAHEGIPSFGWEMPDLAFAIPAAERESRCLLTSDQCVIDGKWFFVRGCLEIAVQDSDEPLSWGVWVSLSENSFHQFSDSFESSHRAHLGPFFGWLCTHIGLYPDTRDLKTNVHIRDHGLRPYIELQPTDHPLAVEQHTGITMARVAEICSQLLHRH